MTLSAPSNATIADAAATGTIVDDDPLPGLRADDASIAEGNTGTTPVSIPVKLLVPSGRSVSVAYATADGTATAGSDYVAASGTVTFAPGETTKAVVVSVNGDATLEPAETFTLSISGPTNATLADASATVTITNDDASPTLAVSDVSVNEGDSGTRTPLSPSRSPGTRRCRPPPRTRLPTGARPPRAITRRPRAPSASRRVYARPSTWP